MREDFRASSLSVALNDYKRDITSQGGENGIIEKMFEVIGVHHRVLVDVGAFDLKRLSNVQPLWQDGGWRAVLIEGNRIYYERMRKQEIPSHVTLLNVYAEAQGCASLDNVLRSLALPQGFDLLSIDVDGIDYHLWKHVEYFKPRAVIIEYNPTIPPHLSIVGKEKRNYVGASARALTNLGIVKGYALAACTSTNLFFVLSEYASSFKDAGDLDALFDFSALNYAMTSYDGGLFYSNRRFPYGYTPFSHEARRHLEDSSGIYIPSHRLLFYGLLKARGWLRRMKREILKPVYLWFAGIGVLVSKTVSDKVRRGINARTSR